MLHCILNEIHNCMTFKPSETAKTEVSCKNIDIQSTELREDNAVHCEVSPWSCSILTCLTKPFSLKVRLKM